MKGEVWKTFRTSLAFRGFDHARRDLEGRMGVFRVHRHVFQSECAIG